MIIASQTASAIGRAQDSVLYVRNSSRDQDSAHHQPVHVVREATRQEYIDECLAEGMALELIEQGLAYWKPTHFYEIISD